MTETGSHSINAIMNELYELIMNAPPGDLAARLNSVTDIIKVRLLAVEARDKAAEGMAEALEILSSRIWRDKKMNACGMKAGDALEVHVLEKALSNWRKVTK